jgi:molybdopterin-biosynthesis enzyme MoeA-like protein
MSEKASTPTAAVLIIGNEILSGRTSDVNLNAIALKLMPLGINLTEARIVRDVESEIVEAVNALRARVTYLFTTGGIGPTHDDITAASVARAFSLPLVEHPEAKERIVNYYTGDNLNDERLRMAAMPQGAVLIDNPVSVIPGFQIGNVFVLAGVPDVMTAMLDIVVSRLERGPAIHVATINCRITEGLLAHELAEVAARYPELDIGSYPSFRLGQVGVAIVVRGTNAALVRNGVDDIIALIARHNGNPELET